MKNQMPLTKNRAIALSGALLFASLVLTTPALPGESSPPASGTTYTADGRLVLPEDYRTWVYLTSGFDMAYSAMAMAGHHMFDNVFVQPQAYKAFLSTGTWPEKTVLVLETRGAQDKGSINKNGHFQGGEVMGFEVHIKDSTRFPGQWAFFGFENDRKPAQKIAQSEECYVCHADHAAVDTTFVQFYPTLLPIATAKGTLSHAYQMEANK